MIFTRTKEPPTGKGWVCVRVRPLTGNLRGPDGGLLLAWEWDRPGKRPIQGDPAPEVPEPKPHRPGLAQIELFEIPPQRAQPARKTLPA